MHNIQLSSETPPGSTLVDGSTVHPIAVDELAPGRSDHSPERCTHNKKVSEVLSKGVEKVIGRDMHLDDDCLFRLTLPTIFSLLANLSDQSLK